MPRFFSADEFIDSNVESIRRMRLLPQDIIVLKLKQDQIHHAAADEIKSRLRVVTGMPELQVIVLTAGDDLYVLEADHEAR